MIKKWFILLLFSCGGLLYADSIGPRSPSTCVNDATGIVGGTDWTSVTNAQVEDGVVARETSATSNLAKCTGYGFSVPSNTIIDGIYVEFKRRADSGKFAVDNSVRVYKAGVAVGDDKFRNTGSDDWPDTALTWAGYGSATDTWNVTWTYADINDSGFGSGLSGSKNAGGANPFDLDAERITVYFHYIPLKTKINTGKLRNAVLK